MTLVDAVREDGDPCCSVGCDVPAEVTVFWPGKTCGMCLACADRAKRVALAMGFTLAITPREKGHKGITP
jgi:hypothetical protein